MQVGHLSWVPAATSFHTAFQWHHVVMSLWFRKESLNYSTLISGSTFSLNDVIENKVVEGTLILFVNLIFKILEFPGLVY